MHRYREEKGESMKNMNSVNKTLYIPLYGKAYVSQRHLFLRDKKAEEIWEAEAFPLARRSRSKWLAYYMGIRSAVFDGWLGEQMKDAAVIHIGCGMDSRVLRIGDGHPMWYDVDLPEVIAERKRYYTENDRYQMRAGDLRDVAWLEGIPQSKKAIVVMEGVGMYLAPDELRSFMVCMDAHFEEIALLMDCYTVLAAKLSRYRNPVKEVGVMSVYGIDDPTLLAVGGFSFVKEHDMTPERYIDELCGMEKRIFRSLYAGGLSKKLYRLFEYRKNI